MISDFRVSNLESKLTIQATTWDEKIQIPKLELRGVNEKVTQCQRQGSEGQGSEDQIDMRVRVCERKRERERGSNTYEHNDQMGDE